VGVLVLDVVVLVTDVRMLGDRGVVIVRMDVRGGVLVVDRHRGISFGDVVR
jgi:hypothetical protein